MLSSLESGSVIYRELWPNQIDLLCFNTRPSPKAAVNNVLPSISRTLLKRGAQLTRKTKGVFFAAVGMWHTFPWFVNIFLTTDSEVHLVLNYVTLWTVHIQYDNLCNVIYHDIPSLFITMWDERVIYCYVICCLLIGLITLEKKTP